jgi:hypothetical protein
MKTYVGMEVQMHIFLISISDWKGGCHLHAAAPLLLTSEPPAPVGWEAEWAWRWVWALWRGEKCLDPAGYVNTNASVGRPVVLLSRLAPLDLQFITPELFPQSVFVCFWWFSEQTNYCICPDVFNRLVCRYSDWATGWTTRESRFEIPAGPEIPLMYIVRSLAVQPTHRPVQCIPGALSLGLKWPGCDYSLPPSAMELCLHSPVYFHSIVVIWARNQLCV